MLTHYGATAVPCRVSSAIRIRKGKVEASIGHAQNTSLKGLRFERLAEAQAYLDRWATKCQVAAMLPKERPVGRCRLEPFRYHRFGERAVYLAGGPEIPQREFAGASWIPTDGA